MIIFIHIVWIMMLLLQLIFPTTCGRNDLKRQSTKHTRLSTNTRPFSRQKRFTVHSICTDSSLTFHSIVHQIRHQTLMMSGAAGELICQAAKEHNADMIVMGSRGLNALRRSFLGSISSYTLDHAHIPVVIVPTQKHS